MIDAPLSAAAHYRALALDAHQAAKVIEDPSNKRIMQRVAMGYENLAINAEARQNTADWWQTSSRPRKETQKCEHQFGHKLGPGIEAAPWKGGRRIPATSPSWVGSWAR